MLQIVYTNRMKRDVRRMHRRGKDLSKLEDVLDLLASQAKLPEKYRDHPLSGELSDFRECHIALLAFQISVQPNHRPVLPKPLSPLP